MTRADKLLTAAILLIALAGVMLISRLLFFSQRSLFSQQAIVTVHGQVERRIDLIPGTPAASVVINGRLGPSVVEVSGGKIRMREAGCPQQICIRQGWIENLGESIVCLPGEIVIRIDGQAPVDAVSR